jgi:hypothetical protein
MKKGSFSETHQKVQRGSKNQKSGSSSFVAQPHEKFGPGERRLELLNPSETMEQSQMLESSIILIDECFDEPNQALPQYSIVTAGRP